MRFALVIFFFNAYLSYCQEFTAKKLLTFPGYVGFVEIEYLPKSQAQRLSILNYLNGRGDMLPFYNELKNLYISDVNNDGVPDICIEISKKTQFDPVLKRRLFIYQIKDNQLVPLWLASRLANPFLELAFYDTKPKTILYALEQTPSQKYAISQYRWGEFGMIWEAYLIETPSLEEAKRLFDELPKNKQ